MNWSSVPSMEASQQIRTVLFRELYRFFTDEEALRPLRSGLPRSGFPRSGATSPDPAGSGPALPPPLARSVAHFYTLLRTAAVAGTDHALAEQIAAGVSAWFASIWEDLQHQGQDGSAWPAPPFAKEASLGEAPPSGKESSSRKEAPGAPPSREGLERDLRVACTTWPRHRLHWEEVQRKLPFAATERQLQVLQHRFLEIRRQALQEQRELQQERALRLVANPLADHLNNLLPRLQHHQEQLQELLGVTGRWDILEADPREISWEVLRECKTFLDRAPGLNQLCRNLLRDLAPPAPGAATPRELRSGQRQIEEDQGCGEITGLGLGSAFPGVLPGELALLADDATETLFLRKLADQALLQLQYQRLCVKTRKAEPPAPEQAGTRPPRGRLIFCIDTSGSMRGTPERVARATLLGVFREALRTGKALTLFACTPRLEVLETAASGEANPEGGPAPGMLPPTLEASAPPEVSQELLLDLLEFLERPFTEGYDVSPAMEAALNLLDSLDPEISSDVVVVSDIPYPRIPPRHLNRMHQLQRSRRARFHALTIHEEPMKDPLNVFDYRWFFNTSPRPEGTSTTEPPMIGLDSRAFLHF
ncbi:hypothetical protein [Alkalispirochaeta sphaeroplastigenens]|nr:hypothetical protein [Alkalispirochaeta sphaeroplastigenens]